MHIEDKDLTTALAEEAGAPLQAAVYARVPTALGVTRWLGPLGNYLVARPAARSAARGTTEETGVPLDAAVILAFTAAELHIWKADPMMSRVGDHLGTVERSRIASVVGETAKSWWPVTITLDDGQTIEVEARGDVRSFLDAAEAAAA